MFVIDIPIGFGWRLVSAGDKPPPYGLGNFIGITLSSVGVGASTTRFPFFVTFSTDRLESDDGKEHLIHHFVVPLPPLGKAWV